ncbi:MAG TPA: hypothetical protein VND15_01825 [Candidatus Acidoferrales bacterium]|nr:hypothetical protein [Candidatus Acidoferrales bacterium]
MKAQAAIMEAFLSMAVLAASISVFAVGTYNYSSSLGSMSVNQSNAAYDVSNIAFGNYTLHSCILLWDRSCLYNFTSAMRSHYALGYLAIGINGGNTAASGSAVNCRGRYNLCLPFSGGNTSMVMCITSCI